MVEGSPGEPRKWIDNVTEVVRHNHEFLEGGRVEAFVEAVEFMNDAIDHVRSADWGGDLRAMARHVRFYFGLNVLLPVSYAIYMDMLAGNLPACYMQLRLALESLARCYLADANYPEGDFFADRLVRLEAEGSSTSQILRSVDKRLRQRGRFTALWGKLSDWVHGAQSIRRVVGQVGQKGTGPPPIREFRRG